VLVYRLVQLKEANKSILEGVCNHGVTQFLGWGKFGTTTAPFGGPVVLRSKLNDQEVEGGKGTSAWLQFGAIRRS
jgi:hypothetical protein